MDEEYKKLLSKVEDILQTQDKQKQRGINDYNMLSVVRKPSHEVGMHSNVLYSLLNPEGLHYQGRLFLDLFIEHVLREKIEHFQGDISVQAEELTDANRRIDFTIKSSQCCIGIEMKVNAKDSKDQIFDYYQYLLQENEHNRIVPKMYYLTKYGVDASESSAKGIAATNISFSKDILYWLQLCQKEVQNITNLNLAFDNYIEVVKKITKQHRTNIMTIEEELVKDKTHISAALNLIKKERAIKGQVLYKFFADVTQFTEGNGYELIHPTEKALCNASISGNKPIAELNLTNCKNWFLSNSSKKVEGLGLFIDCNLKDNLFIHIQATSKHLLIGVVKCLKLNEQWQWVDISSDSESYKFLDLTFRTWKEYPNWWSIDYGNIYNMEPQSVSDLITFQGSSLSETLLALIKYMQEKRTH